MANKLEKASLDVMWNEQLETVGAQFDEGKTMSEKIHVIPVGHPEPLHLAKPHCWCSPLQESARLYIHHAKDGREKWERQGIIDQDKNWIIVHSGDDDTGKETHERT